MIQPSTLNVIIITLSALIGFFLLRMLAVKLHDHPIGQALSVAV